MSIIISLEERVNIEPYRADLVPIENFNSIHNNHDLPDNRDLPISRFNSMSNRLNFFFPVARAEITGGSEVTKN